MKTILIDSGKVLNGPTTGHWFIPPCFFEIINKDSFNKIAKNERDQAFSHALKFIDEFSYFEDEAIEYERFIDFYNELFKRLPSLGISYDNSRKIAYDLVYNPLKYTFYDDVLGALDKLSKNHKLAVVSDAWPSLKRVFVHVGIFDMFESFVISTCIGSKKPEAKMYMTALEETNTSPKDAIFIDDNINNLEGARAVGIETTYLMCRESYKFWFYKLTQKKHIVVKNFDDIVRDMEI